MINKIVQLLFIGIEVFYESLTNIVVFNSKLVDIVSVFVSVQSWVLQWNWNCPKSSKSGKFVLNLVFPIAFYSGV